MPSRALASGPAVAGGVLAIALGLFILGAVYAPALPAPTPLQAVVALIALGVFAAACLAAVAQAWKKSALGERVWVSMCGVAIVLVSLFELFTACVNVHLALGGHC
jgi:hypothetical protein